jgi:TnpA family transposase
LREIGRIERSLFTMDWLKSPELHRRAHARLNKGEARNALARAIFFHSLGELRDRTFENQFFRASGPASTCWSPPSFCGTRGILSAP